MNQGKMEKQFRDSIWTLNEQFYKSTKTIDDFMVESLKWYDEMKVPLENESAKTKLTRKKKGGNVQLPAVLLKDPCQQRVTRSNSVLNTINKVEHINLMNDSVSANTRGARKNLRESRLAAANVTYNQNDTSRTTRGRGPGRGRNTEKPDVENDSARHKRPAEEEQEEDNPQSDISPKRLKQEPLTPVEISKNGNVLIPDGLAKTEVFKKPQNWPKKPKRTAQESGLSKTIDSEMVEESQFFNAALLHSSPKENPGPSERNTFILPHMSSNISQSSPKPNSPSVCSSTPREKEKNQDQLQLSTSKDFIKDSEDENSIPCKETTAAEAANLKNTSRETRATRTKNRKPKSASKDSPAGDVRSGSLRKSEIPAKGESPSQNGDESRMETVNSNKSSTQVVLENPLMENPLASASASKENLSNIVAGKKSKMKSFSDKNSSDVKDSAEAESVNVSASREVDLNATKKMPKATKRTKPVLKSKIFDSQGNVMPVGVDETAAEGPQEKTRTLRSSEARSSKLRTDVHVKQEVIRPSKAEEPMELAPISERMSNQENEPQNKKTKRTKVKKEVVSDVPADTGRITRTKSKQAKQAMKAVEAAARKSGMKIMARKSVNKAKIMSVHLEKLKTMKILKPNSVNAKAQTQVVLSKLNSATKNHELLCSSSKLKSPMVRNNVICLGSQKKVPSTSYCTEVGNNVLLTGKGKYESKEKLNTLITPGKRWMTPESSVKSATKTLKEDPVEKELLLKALKEKTEKAASKKDMAIKNRQKELKQKNEMKLLSATKQRQKLELEKYNNIVQLEKEKEERHNLLLQEMKEGLEEKRLRKQIMTQKKLADTEERRRLVEEERVAKLKEQAAELEKKMLERQKELERQEKRAQEHMDEMRMREMFVKKQKEEQMMTEKKVAAVQSACKIPKPALQTQKWNYKPRNENDYGLEDEKSELESETEEQVTDHKRIPLWAKGVKKKKYPFIYKITQKMLLRYVACHEKTPNIERMFNMTPNKRIKRTSSAIWNTPGPE